MAQRVESEELRVFYRPPFQYFGDLRGISRVGTFLEITLVRPFHFLSVSFYNATATFCMYLEANHSIVGLVDV